MDSDLTPVGIYNFRNQHKTFGIKVDDRRRHIYVVGKTGVGKSTLLENMIIADIRSGKGVGVVDPHGELAEKILDFIPEERLDDVIYFDPSDMDYPIAFNPMEQVGNEFRHLVASGIMGVFKKIWPDAWSARMEYILNNTLLALLELPDATLLGILRMFAEPEYRKKIVDNLKDPVIKAFWQNEFARYSQKLETEALAAIQNKVGQFVSNPLIRNILGQPRSSLNMRQIMDTGKIFIVNLSKGKIGEDNSALLGAMIITRLNLAAMSRVDVAEQNRRDFFLYVDEFQNFATDSFANILSEARKYHLSLTLAHQYIGQLMTSDSTKVRDAIFGNVGTIVSFRVGADDAEFLEKEFMPEFLQTDLVNLGKANIYIKLMIDGIASRPFSATTVPPQSTPLNSYRDVIIKNSREKYGTPKAVVEARIAGEWLAKSDAAIGEKIERQGERHLSEVLRPRPGLEQGLGNFARRPLPSNQHSPGGPSVYSAPRPAPSSAPLHPASSLRPAQPFLRQPQATGTHQPRRMQDVEPQRGPVVNQENRSQPATGFSPRPDVRPELRPQNQIQPTPSSRQDVVAAFPRPVERIMPRTSLPSSPQLVFDERAPAAGHRSSSENAARPSPTLSLSSLLKYKEKNLDEDGAAREAEAPVSADAKEPAMPRKFARPNVDIVGLRSAINASLKRQNEAAHGTASPSRPVRLNVPAANDMQAQIKHELSKMDAEQAVAGKQNDADDHESGGLTGPAMKEGDAAKSPDIVTEG